VSAGTTGPSGSGALRTSSWSIDAFPQTPQLDVAKKFRCSDDGSNGARR
jgi:hypothetical protein